MEETRQNFMSEIKGLSSIEREVRININKLFIGFCSYVSVFLSLWILLLKDLILPWTSQKQ
jgi:hypothetical protein